MLETALTGLPKRQGKVFHTLEDIDFSNFVGKRIGVLGVLATAIDNTATALEAGAREAICYARRPHLPLALVVAFAAVICGMNVLTSR